MAKVYLRAVNTTQFEWVDNPEQATSDDVDSLKVTLKRFKAADLTQIPQKTQPQTSKWVISSEK